MYTFVYLQEKSCSSQIKGVACKNAYFCKLLHTFHIWRDWVLLKINALSATEAERRYTKGRRSRHEVYIFGILTTGAVV